VIGRAGREQGRGVGYLQTHQPEHPVMKRWWLRPEAFYASEIEATRTRRLPAVRRLASLICPPAIAPRRKLRAPARRHRPDRSAHPGAGPAEAPLR